MDLLTHLFLPITVAYVLWPELFPSPWYLALAGFAVLPDADKLLGLQGALHSVVTLGILAGIMVAVERRYRGATTYAALATLLLGSHLFLDILDGGPVTLLYPLVDAGVGLEYPTQLILGDGTVPAGIRDPLPTVRIDAPSRSRRAYPLFTGYGVLSAVTFAVVVARDRIRERVPL